MSDRELIVDITLDGLADNVSSFMNKYKSQLLLKGYAIKNEWDIMESAGGRIIGRRKVDLGGGIEVEKKVGKKFKVQLEIRAVDDDIRLTVWPSKKKQEIPMVMVDELEKSARTVESKIKQ